MTDQPTTRDAVLARVIEEVNEQVDDDWTTADTLAFREYFGERTATRLADAGLLADPEQHAELDKLRVLASFAAGDGSQPYYPGTPAFEAWQKTIAERDALQVRLDRVSETCEAAATGIAIGMARNPARWECAEAAIEDVRAALQGDQPAAVTDNGDPHTVDAAGTRHYEPKTLEVSQPHEQRCASCNGTNITYQAFSGGREYYCEDCDDVFPYDDGKAPRRAQMLADGRHEELRGEMREHLRAEPDPGCDACGRPRTPDHDSAAPGPTVRHPYRPRGRCAGAACPDGPCPCEPYETRDIDNPEGT